IDELQDFFKFSIVLANAAIAGNHGCLLEYLVDKHNGDATRIGYIETATYEGYAIDIAAKKGQLNMVQYLHKSGNTACTTNAMDRAAANEHFDIVQWLHENRTEGCISDAIDEAASRGHLKIIKFLYENRSEKSTESVMSLASRGGHLDVIKYLEQNRPRQQKQNSKR
ncbi:ankyrin repeat, partial [Thraustotheca clavata]